MTPDIPDSVLIFPPVTSYHRLLIHKTVEEDFKHLCSFSIGEGDNRRTVVCQESQILPEYRFYMEQSAAARSQSGLGSRGRGRRYANHTSPSPAPGVGSSSWHNGRDSESCKTREVHPSPDSRLGPVGRELTVPDNQKNITTMPASSGVSDQTQLIGEKPKSRGRGRSRHPDVQIYVPRGRRPAQESTSSLHSSVVTSLDNQNSSVKPDKISSPVCVQSIQEVLDQDGHKDLPCQMDSKESSGKSNQGHGPRPSMEVYVPRHRRVKQSIDVVQPGEASSIVNTTEVKKREEEKGNDSVSMEVLSSTSSVNNEWRNYKSSKHERSESSELQNIESSTERVKHKSKEKQSHKYKEKIKEKKEKRSSKEKKEKRNKIDASQMLCSEEPAIKHGKDEAIVNDVPKVDAVRDKSIFINCNDIKASCSVSENLNSDIDLRDNSPGGYINSDKSAVPIVGETVVHMQENIMKQTITDQLQTQSSVPLSEDIVISIEKESLLENTESKTITKSEQQGNCDTSDYNFDITSESVIYSQDTESQKKGTQETEILDEKNNSEHSINTNESDMLNSEMTNQSFSSDIDSKCNMVPDTYVPLPEVSEIENHKTDLVGFPRNTVDSPMKSNDRPGGEYMAKVKETSEICLEEMREHTDSGITQDDNPNVIQVIDSVHKKENYREVEIEDLEDEDQSEDRDKTDMETEEAEEDSWDALFDENGEALDSTLLDELTAAVGEVKVKKAQFDYYNYQPADPELDDSSYGHLVEICDFPAEFITRDIILAFKQFQDKGFDVKWVDDTHCIGIFSSRIAANQALELKNPMFKVCPISQATRATKIKAKRCADFLEPYKPRPETSASVARNLVANALGLKTRVSKEKRDEERRKLKEAKGKHMM